MNRKKKPPYTLNTSKNLDEDILEAEIGNATLLENELNELKESPGISYLDDGQDFSKASKSLYVPSTITS